MDAKLEASPDRPLRGLSLTTELWAYLATAFGFSWAMWVGVIKLGLAEEFLNIGTAGPAVAAIILSRGSRWNDGLRSRTRCVASLC